VRSKNAEVKKKNAEVKTETKLLHSEFLLLNLKPRGLQLAASSFLPGLPGEDRREGLAR
jgi:hypothetical protein